MYNTYDFKITRPDIIKQLAVKDMLFAYYKCPQVDKILHVFTHFNEIAYTLSGKRHCIIEKNHGLLLITHLCLLEELPIRQKNMILRVGRFLPSVFRMIFCDKYLGNTGNIYR